MQFLEYVIAGFGVGMIFGMFGAGGSAFATPVLALIGVPPLMAIASPLPAMVPAAFTGARRYLRAGNIDGRVAKLTILGGVPGALVGALTSSIVGGNRLLVLSGVMLLAIGIRLLMRDALGSSERGAKRRGRTGLVVVSAFGVGFLTGLLANGGGFLLVPLFILVLGLTAIEAAGTSMVVVGVLTVPTLITHWMLGHIDWTVAGGFAVGLIPAAAVGARLAQRMPPARSRYAFGTMLVVFATWFLIHQLT